MRVSYLLTAAVALVITRTSYIFVTIVYALEAFAICYTLQAGVAVLIVARQGDNWPRGEAATFDLVVAFGHRAEVGRLQRLQVLIV